MYGKLFEQIFFFTANTKQLFYYLISLYRYKVVNAFGKYFNQTPNKPFAPAEYFLDSSRGWR